MSGSPPNALATREAAADRRETESAATWDALDSARLAMENHIADRTGMGFGSDDDHRHGLHHSG